MNSFKDIKNYHLGWLHCDTETLPFQMLSINMDLSLLKWLIWRSTEQTIKEINMHWVLQGNLYIDIYILNTLLIQQILFL